MAENKEINAHSNQKIVTVEDNLNKKIDGLKNDFEHKWDNLQDSIENLINQQQCPPEEEYLIDTILGEEAQLQLQLQEGLKEEPTEDLEELQDAPQLCVIYGPWEKEEEILPLLSEESNGKEAGEEPQKSNAQPQNSPLPVYILPTPAANPKPAALAPKTHASPSLLVQNIRKLMATGRAFATTSKTQAVAHIAWHSGWFGCRFGFGASEPRHF